MQTRNPNNARGIDVSHYQGEIDWSQVKASGISFAFIKATEGHTMVDDKFVQNAQGAKAAGVLVGPYHFCRASTVDEANQEADHFLSTVASAGASMDLPYCLDIETTEGGTRETIVTICRAFTDKVKAAGFDPMLYTYPNFADNYLDESLKDIKLWFANYGTNQPADHAGWTAWEFMQCDDKGTVPGISGEGVDLDEFKGSVDELTGKTTTPSLNPDIANNIINSYLTKAWDSCNVEYQKALSDGRTGDADAWKQLRDWQHFLANQLREAAGLPTE